MVSKSITEKYTDISTLDNFQFIFHCQRCGADIPSENYTLNVEGINQPIYENVRTLLWLRQHRNALERASGEARYELNTCTGCGRLVCTKCFHLDAEPNACGCLDCYKKTRIPSFRRIQRHTIKKKEEATHMLTSVTRQYKDFSTPDEFAFAFYCDRCGREWQSDNYRFERKGFETPMDERIRTMLWYQQHEEAYERANCEAGARFNRCPICGCRICDDCLYIGSKETPNSCKTCGDTSP